MRRVRYCVAMSLDGFIADRNGESDWIVMDPDIDFGEVFQEFDTVLLGRKTYEITRQKSGGPAMPGMQTYVFSHTLRPDDCAGVVVSDDPAATLAELTDKSGKDIWLFGGGSLFSSLLQLGLVATVEVTVMPVLLGGGLPLLPNSAASTKLTLIENTIYEKTGTVALKYSVG